MKKKRENCAEYINDSLAKNFMRCRLLERTTKKKKCPANINNENSVRNPNGNRYALETIDWLSITFCLLGYFPGFRNCTSCTIRILRSFKNRFFHILVLIFHFIQYVIFCFNCILHAFSFLYFLILIHLFYV